MHTRRSRAPFHRRFGGAREGKARPSTPGRPHLPFRRHRPNEPVGQPDTVKVESADTGSTAVKSGHGRGTGQVVPWRWRSLQVGECHYASKLVNSILERKSLSLELEKASMKKGLGLRSGVIKNIEIKKQNLADYIKLPTNNKVNLPRNDISISNNGYVYMSGNSLDDMHKKYGELVESIRVTYL